MKTRGPGTANTRMTAPQPRSSKPPSRHCPGSRAAGTGAPITTSAPWRRSPPCTARCGASGSTTPTRPPSSWSANTTSSRTKTSRSATWSRPPHPKPDPDQPGTFLPNGAAAKAGLNHSIMDAGWGVFLTILHAKAESAGREVIAVDPRNTSRTCPECGAMYRPLHRRPHRRGRRGSRTRRGVDPRDHRAQRHRARDRARRPRHLDDLQEGLPAADRPRRHPQPLTAESLQRQPLQRGPVQDHEVHGRLPERFDSLAHAREWFDAFISYYNHEHRHSGIGLAHPRQSSTSAPPRRSATSEPPPSPTPTHATPNASPAAPTTRDTPAGMDQRDQDGRWNPFNRVPSPVVV